MSRLINLSSTDTGCVYKMERGWGVGVKFKLVVTRGSYVHELLFVYTCITEG